MSDLPPFLPDAQKLLARLEKDLRQRCDERPDIVAPLRDMYEKAREKGRTGFTFEEWRAGMITQHAVGWVLSCVFVRYLEDNDHLEKPKLSGIGHRLLTARSEYDLYFRDHPHDNDRDYLHAIFGDLGSKAATKELFDKYNLVRLIPDWLSPDAAKDDVIPFFQRREGDERGRLLYPFNDPPRDSRFLGDLYQDLSEAARKAFALLQTPTFVEEFILERTLRPAIETFGLENVRMIDPACGSGHFLLGGFRILLCEWVKREPDPRQMRKHVNRVLAAVHGVDLNPYAVAIARFRLILAAWKAVGGVGDIRNMPAFETNLACGDSLLHGDWPEQEEFNFDGEEHHYAYEDREALRRLLRSKHYHAVVANPPYIVPRDKGANEGYRRHWSACHRQYSMSVPFMQRIFDLACEGGYTGQITANSFMKREFGKKLIAEFLPTIDLTHVIDTSGAYIPGHGTPTVILFGRKHRPVGARVRAVMGIRGEPTTPDDPASGQVWTAIMEQIDQLGSKSAFVSVADSPRETFHRHPWSIGGGGAAELKEEMDSGKQATLEKVVDSIGFCLDTHADEAFVQPPEFFRRHAIGDSTRKHVRGDEVRDWGLASAESILFPYDDAMKQWSDIPRTPRWSWLWQLRTELWSRSVFGGATYRTAGRPWFDYHQFPKDRLRTPLSIAFAFVATHNHFVLDRGGKVFNRHAPLVKLPGAAGEEAHLALLGLLNSSTACFWMKQVFSTKGSSGIGRGVYDEAWEKHHEFAATGLGLFPLPAGRPLDIICSLADLALGLAEHTPARVLARWDESSPLTPLLKEAQTNSRHIRGRMIALQEDLDWRCYSLYGHIDDDLSGPSAGGLILGHRAFEIVMARKMRDEGMHTAWFDRHGSTPTPDTDDPLTLRRIAAIESNPSIALIEQPEYKRRWSDTPWGDKVKEALHGWLLDRLESYFDIDGRMNDAGTPTARIDVSLLSTTSLATLAGSDSAFQAVAAHYREMPEFNVGRLVAELVEAESIPLLPILRCKPSGLDKRLAWERTWDLQRREDAIDARVTLQSMGVNDGDWSPGGDDGTSPINAAQAAVLKRETVGPIPPPPKYKSADFLKSDYWRLRGGLDVPKERWVIFPHCEGADGQPLVAWAGYDHLQLAKAIGQFYQNVKDREGGRDDPRLVPLLACVAELLPWLKQWHNGYADEYGGGPGDWYEGFVQDEARDLGLTVEQVRAWVPPARSGRGRRTT